MIDIQKITAYTEEIKSQIPEIKSTFLVIDDSQLSNYLKETSESDNLILVGFIPSHSIDGSTDDPLTTDSMVWLILKKTDRSQRSFIETMQECQRVTKTLVKKMINDKPSFDNSCGIMRMLQIATINIDPVWAINSCDGYEISYQLKSSIYK